MKKLSVLIGLILSCQILTGQIKTDYELLSYDFTPIEVKRNWEPVKIIGVIAGSIILEAIGDAKYDTGDKFQGKLFQAASVGLLVASPFILNIDRKKWGWYFASYLSFRIAGFDFIYNGIRGLPIEYIGTTSAWDRGLQKFNLSKMGRIWGSSMFLILAISIPINEF